MHTTIPTKTVGPILFSHPSINAEISVPLATYESPLWPSVSRGAKLSRLCGGIYTEVTDECMTRSFIMEAPNLKAATATAADLQTHTDDIKTVIAGTSSFATFKSISTEVVGNLLYIRLSIHPQDAAGHNMATKSTEALIKWVLAHYPELEYVSISGNVCTDKKASAVNGLLGRGRRTAAEIRISAELCHKHLKTTPEAIVDLHIKKNLIGSTLAGSIRSANAHFANMLLAIYLATGQDAANIIEGSQGMTHATVKGGDLLFSVNLPNVIVGTTGNGKDLDFVQDNLTALGCTADVAPGQNATRLAHIVAATVLCGELSLMAAQTNLEELMRCHQVMERRK
jgi:hydroxymethylglutaryl-CoA reductase (NADPH)